MYHSIWAVRPLMWDKEEGEAVLYPTSFEPFPVDVSCSVDSLLFICCYGVLTFDMGIMNASLYYLAVCVL